MIKVYTFKSDCDSGEFKISVDESLSYSVYDVHFCIGEHCVGFKKKDLKTIIKTLQSIIED